MEFANVASKTLVKISHGLRHVISPLAHAHAVATLRARKILNYATKLIVNVFQRKVKLGYSINLRIRYTWLKTYVFHPSIPIFVYYSLDKALSSCHDHDSRDVEWHGDPNERVNKSCNEGNFHDEKFVEGAFFLSERV